MLWNVAEISVGLGNADMAAAQFAEALTLFIEFGDRWFCVVVLESSAFLAAATGDTERAVLLLGAADTALNAIGVPLLARYREQQRLAYEEEPLEVLPVLPVRRSEPMAPPVSIPGLMFQPKISVSTWDSQTGQWRKDPNPPM